ncbi:MAG: AraC family transcriptional regulator [Chitinophagaceae bacterium]|nr:AraC family transcriptional regulator [Chitinophagaceae bacterium]
MQYITTPPHPALTPYIDAYWSVNGAGHGTVTNRILPDGCVDIIFNVGEDDQVMKSGKAYLVGTMTRTIESMVNPDTHLVGVRFKPAAFSVFYKFSSLHEITDRAIECEKGLAPALACMKAPTEGWNKFFLEKVSEPGHALFPILEDIQRRHGQVRVEELTRRHFVTARQLERSFKYYTGISPKEFINQARFRHALQAIRHRQPGKDLADIAFACGYYDQAHLSNEIRRYSGTMPSQL